jgi:hypothetical protein
MGSMVEGGVQRMLKVQRQRGEGCKMRGNEAQ